MTESAAPSPEESPPESAPELTQEWPGEMPEEAAAPGMLRLVATVFLPFAGGYFLSYLFRSTNAIIAPQLIREIGLSASDIGLLTSAFFLAFATFQIPLGVLLDRFGPRRVQAGFLLFAALGAVLFARSQSRDALALGRAFMGLGVAGGLMASFKAITLWFPMRRWPLVNGCFMAMGGLGAMSSTLPMEAALRYTDWRGVFLGLAAVTVGVSAIILFVVPEKPGRAKAVSLIAQVKGLQRIFTDRLFWRLAPITVAVFSANMAIQTLWAGLWLRDVAGFDRGGVAAMLFLLTAMMTVGFVASGAVADVLERRGISLGRVMGWGTVVFMLAQAAVVFEADQHGVWPWIVFGLSMNFVILSYSWLSRHFPLAYSGRVNTGLNVFVFAGIFLAQFAMGAIIDLWPLAADGGYRPEAYRAAFGTFLALEALAFVWFLNPVRRR